MVGNWRGTFQSRSQRREPSSQREVVLFLGYLNLLSLGETPCGCTQIGVAGLEREVVRLKKKVGGAKSGK